VETLVPLGEGAPLLDGVNDALVGAKVSAHVSIGDLIVLVVVLGHVVVLGSSGGGQQGKLCLLLASATNITKKNYE